MTLKDRLKHYRKKARLSQEEAARRLNISRGCLVNFERGYSEPRVSVALRMSKVYGVNILTLIVGSDITAIRPGYAVDLESRN